MNWFGSQRRGYYIVREIRKRLVEAGLATTPSFESVYIDSDITFRLVAPAAPNKPADDKSSHTLATDTSVALVDLTAGSGTLLLMGGTASDPTHRIGRLPRPTLRPCLLGPIAQWLMP